MRIYDNAYELMSETGRNLWEMGITVKPKTYQNKNIEGNEDFVTKEMICEQYCLLQLPDPSILFHYTKAQKWAEAEFHERISGEKINPGEAWELRRDLWEQFLNTCGGFDYSYPERINQPVHIDIGIPDITYLDAIIDLLRNDPDTRKAVLSIFDPTLDQFDIEGFTGKRRIPCSMYYNFLIRENAKGEKQLNICYHQRSSDFITHFGNDVYLAWKLMEYVAYNVGVKPGNLFHTIDSLHVYKKDWDILKSSL